MKREQPKEETADKYLSLTTRVLMHQRVHSLHQQDSPYKKANICKVYA